MSSLVQMVEEHEAAASADQATHGLEGRLANQSRARRPNKGSRKPSALPVEAQSRRRNRGSVKLSSDAQMLGETLAETEAPQRVRI